jgi:hypothetical protein
VRLTCRSVHIGTNDRGDIAGTLYGVDGLSNAAIYRDGMWIPLDDLLDASGTGWTVSDAWRVNNVGQIAALGITNDWLRMILLTPSKKRRRTEATMTIGSSTRAELAKRAAAVQASLDRARCQCPTRVIPTLHSSVSRFVHRECNLPRRYERLLHRRATRAAVSTAGHRWCRLAVE